MLMKYTDKLDRYIAADRKHKIRVCVAMMMIM
jgi:hypothetical protein